MVVWEPPAREYDFLFNEVFDAIGSIDGLGFEDFDADFLAMLIEGYQIVSMPWWLHGQPTPQGNYLKQEQGYL